MIKKRVYFVCVERPFTLVPAGEDALVASAYGGLSQDEGRSARVPACAPKINTWHLSSCHDNPGSTSYRILLYTIPPVKYFPSVHKSKASQYKPIYQVCVPRQCAPAKIKH